MPQPIIDRVLSDNAYACRGICPCCLTPQSKIRTKPQRTAYHFDEQTEDDPNQFTGCPECWQENKEHWDAMWDEYYRDIL